jgi:hypothetical protein
VTDIIKAVQQFTEGVGCTTDRYNVRQTALYTGLQCEELGEKIEALYYGLQSRKGDVAKLTRLEHLLDVLYDVSQGMKQGEFDAAFERAERGEMLDADIDLAWVTIGSAFSQGADVRRAVAEVARANLGKLAPCPVFACARGERTGGGKCGNCNGTGLVAIKDSNGKVQKPAGWTPPNIEPFTCKRLAESEGGEA